MFLRTRRRPQETFVPPFVLTHEVIDEASIDKEAPADILSGTLDIECTLTPLFDEKRRLISVDVIEEETIYRHIFACFEDFEKPQKDTKTFLVARGGLWTESGDLSLIEPCFTCDGQILRQSECALLKDVVFVGGKGKSLQKAIEGGAIQKEGFASFWCARKAFDSRFISIKLRNKR